MTRENTLIQVDLSDDLSFSNGFPHDFFSWIRINEPVYWHEPTSVTPDGEGFWVVSRYEQVNEIIRNPVLFSSDKGGDRTGGGTAIKDEKTAGKLLNQTDGSQHKRLRALVQKGFTVTAIKKLEEDLRVKAKHLFSGLKCGERVDFARVLAPELPSHAICTVLGVPKKDRLDLCTWIDQGIEAESTSVIAVEYLKKVREYAKSLIAQKKENPEEDIFSKIIHAKFEEDGSSLSDYELGSFFALLFPAGAETTTRSISGGMLALLENPNQMEQLRKKPELMKTAIEEIVRWTTPSVYKRRTATADTELGGKKILMGQKVTLWEMSANRDEAMFSHPFQFDVTRDPNKHLGFGVGVHFCLGASLARLELKVFFEEFLKSNLCVELDQPVTWVPNNRLVGIKNMFVRVTERINS
ncbi:MAG: cytochrome P450 [Gammaproteobacteria bacterium]|jgi:cytochrome P450|tara:strand:- start:2845 stop:4077 length:1233 start_codon:yes stop_codon:yes gene_type:complete